MTNSFYDPTSISMQFTANRAEFVRKLDMSMPMHRYMRFFDAWAWPAMMSAMHHLNIDALMHDE